MPLFYRYVSLHKTSPQKDFLPMGYLYLPSQNIFTFPTKCFPPFVGNCCKKTRTVFKVQMKGVFTSQNCSHLL